MTLCRGRGTEATQVCSYPTTKEFVEPVSVSQPVVSVGTKHPRIIRPSVIAECIQPRHVVTGFLQALEARRADQARSKSKPWVLRDLHEEAISDLAAAFQSGEAFPILAPSIDQADRKTFKVDAKLRDAVVQIARARSVTYGAVYYTAFHRYLRSQGILDQAW